MSKRFTYWNSFSSIVYLLDAYPSATVAFSLRQLSTSSTNVVRVRRSSDNAERDFTASDITDGTITTWTGANDGFCTIFYDQSGNVNNATQTTAALQPQLVSAGAVLLDNGKPAILLSNAGTMGFNLTTQISNARSIFYVLKWSGSGTSGAHNTLLGSASNYDYHSGSPTAFLNGYASAYVRNGSNYVNSILRNFLSTAPSLTQSLLTLIHTSSSGRIGRISKDRGSSNTNWRGFIQELIVYSTDQASNRTGIEDNINGHYTIF